MTIGTDLVAVDTAGSNVDVEVLAALDNPNGAIVHSVDIVRTDFSTVYDHYTYWIRVKNGGSVTSLFGYHSEPKNVVFPIFVPPGQSLELRPRYLGSNFTVDLSIL